MGKNQFRTGERTSMSSLRSSTGAEEARAQQGGIQRCRKRTSSSQERIAQKFAVVLEDDADPVENFPDQLAKMLAVAPTPVVSLYLGRNYPPHWQPCVARALGPILPPLRRDVCFLVAPVLLHAVGYAIHTKLLDDLLNFSGWDTPVIEDVITAWVQDRGFLVSYCWPSLVDHRDGPSMIQTRQDRLSRQEPRTAWKVGWRRQWNSTTATIEEPERRTG